MRSFVVVVSLALLFVAANLAATQDVDKRTAAQILDAMSQKYQNFKSYSDTGKVKATYIRPERIFSEEKPFKTAFQITWTEK